MNTPCAGGETSKPCYNGCFRSPFFVSDSNKSQNSSVSVVFGSSHDLEEATSYTLHPYTQFTNHEAIPSLQESYANFTKAYPPFGNTSEVDRIRAQEYPHLNLSNICFDYTGHGLFSYVQQQRFCPSTSVASSSSCPPPSALEPPFFDISHKPVNLHSQILHGGQESEIESRIRERIMAFMNISEADYTLVFIANEVSAFKLVAESFQFQSNGELLTVYDHRSEALDAMMEACKAQGAHILSAEFCWPRLGIKYKKLKKMIMSKRDKRKRGLFVFPLHSRVTGAPYSYVWMSLAQENGWHVLVDACAFAPKEMDTLGLTMFKPDFLICSFHKVYGENPSGFGCLFVKKSSVSAIKDSANNPTSLGIISLLPAFRQTQDLQEELQSETSPPHEIEVVSVSEIVELQTSLESTPSRRGLSSVNEIECKGLEHADSVGLIQISCRAKYLINWLVNAMMSLQHPHHPQTGISLIRIYGPNINAHRGPAVAFNVFDWKGEKVDPLIVQKLADRNNISLSSAVLQKIRFFDKNEEEREMGIESRVCETERERNECGISVVTAALGFLTNFEDVYRLWAFLSRFLDADFVEKERWRYMALNQTTIDI
ncbi:hypothetical protein Ahy_Scaffold1g106627 isoform B [Arachis hypogaea]|uniref:Aminotransferase class V domain-containing protein n=1 Tax=Arachis hypogaea TaxID=3818 RepID=A0A444WQW9_ARAHY|nr:hypothetical protein Ahy_Scaffold1g106627 isoform B [Arachis hypogaea]